MKKILRYIKNHPDGWIYFVSIAFLVAASFVAISYAAKLIC